MSSDAGAGDPVLQLTPSDSSTSIAALFGDTILEWGNKYPTAPLIEIWASDRDYLLWAANVSDKKHSYRMPKLQETLIRGAHAITCSSAEEGRRIYENLQRWIALTQRGEGLDTLPRPTPRQCAEIFGKSTLIGGHCDLDGIYGVALAIARGGALSCTVRDGAPRTSGMFGKLRLFRYGFNGVADFRSAVAPREGDVTVIIDYCALPDAALTLDHHATCLSYWEYDAPLPPGIYDTTMPSCPRLLATHCGIKAPEELLMGCDLVDGAQYSTVEQTIDLTNPYVALEHALSLDVSDAIAKKVVITLVENDLDPMSVLSEPIWKARLELLSHEIEEQRRFWSRSSHTKTHHTFVAIADGRLAPYAPSRFRYLPFEMDSVRAKPYLLTIRSGGGPRVNIGLSRNPFYRDPSFFEYHPVNLGSLARKLGRGGGRVEASAFTIEIGQLEQSVARALAEIERACGEAPTIERQ